jgi:hypothetical protein
MVSKKQKLKIERKKVNKDILSKINGVCDDIPDNIDIHNTNEDLSYYHLISIHNIQKSMLEYTKNTGVPLCEYMTSESLNKFLSNLN